MGKQKLFDSLTLGTCWRVVLSELASDLRRLKRITTAETDGKEEGKGGLPPAGYPLQSCRSWLTYECILLDTAAVAVTSGRGLDHRVGRMCWKTDGGCLAVKWHGPGSNES